MTYRLGIDAGSKTVKLVLLDEAGRVVFTQYRLHKSNILTTTRELIHDTCWRFGDVEVSVCVTGSAGMRLAEELGEPHVQEVVVCRHALEQLYPQADVAIELGGEDAKIIYLSDGVEQRMNGSCAGGTGGFIDTIAALLGVRAREFNALALGYRTIYPIASRCAVFAQNDVRPLLNEGARRADIAASVLQAVVTQTIAGLACGRPIQGTVVFLGGPIEVYSELLNRFRLTLGLTHAQCIKPADAHLFVAKGAALLASRDRGSDTGIGCQGDGPRGTTFHGSVPREPSPWHPIPVSLPLSALQARLAAIPLEEDGGIERLRPLFCTSQELEDFRTRHAQAKVARGRLMDASGEVFIGIDAGSTTSKLAVIDKAGRLLYSAYENTQGDVVATTRDLLNTLYASLPHEYDGGQLVTIARTMVCGYGEQLLKTAFCVDEGVVETVAHLRAAREFSPELDFVLDIGGQDIKCLRVKDGIIDDIMLNEACSSGCGALIEGFSRSLGCTVWSFSAAALKAASPVDLGTRCTVFMTSRVRHAQKVGASVADLAAGLAYSVVRNALYKVIACSEPAQLGQHVVVQGGTFCSDAVLRAFELESGLTVVRPDIANLMGAYGCALLARDAVERGEAPAVSGLLTSRALAGLEQISSTRTCGGCTNACLLTISSFTPGGECVPCLSAGEGSAASSQARTFITGNRCERPVAGMTARAGLPNLFEDERDLLAREVSAQSCSADQESADQVRTDDKDTNRHLFEMCPRGSGRPKVGIPAVLDLYQTLPFWRSFFTKLGCEPVSLAPSSAAIYQKGAQSVLSEGVCYPAKLTHGHVAELIEQGASFIFMPSKGTGDRGDRGRSDSEPVPLSLLPLLECPVSRGYAALIADDVAVAQTLEGEAVGFVTCDSALDQPLAEQLLSALISSGLAKRLFRAVSVEDIEHALKAAHRAQKEFSCALAKRTSSALQYIEHSDKKAIVLAGHPYHTDSGISHGVDGLLNSLGFAVLSASGVRAYLEAENPTSCPACRRDAPMTDFDIQQPAATWTRPQELYRVAEFVAAHPQLDFVQLTSFGCGVDALASARLREIIESAGKPFTALKIDEICDLAAIRIRLRSLAAALDTWGDATGGTAGDEATVPLASSPAVPPSVPLASSPVPSTIIMPAIAPAYLHAIQGIMQDAGYELCVLSPLTAADIAEGLRNLSNDLCYPMLAIAGQATAFLKTRANEAPATLLIPQVCSACRSLELANLIRARLRHEGIGSEVEVVGIPGVSELFTLPDSLATQMDEVLANVASEGTVSESQERHPGPDPQPHSVDPEIAGSHVKHGTGSDRFVVTQGDEHEINWRQPRVGIVGNAALLYTPELNDDILKRIQAEGCLPLTPPLTELLRTNVPPEQQVENFIRQGICDIIVVQSFGCLTGHIHGRGALRRLRRRYPALNLSFIEYDSGASRINQLSRLKLALTIAKESQQKRL